MHTQKTAHASHKRRHASTPGGRPLVHHGLETEGWRERQGEGEREREIDMYIYIYICMYMITYIEIEVDFCKGTRTEMSHFYLLGYSARG